jgi:hypothetical protein
MNIDTQLLKRVKGFLAEAEGRCLYEYALAAGRLGPCLEIGSYCGKATIYLGAACRQTNNVLFSIDHHRGSEEQQPGQEYFDPDLVDPATGRIDTFRWFRESIELAGLGDTVVAMVSSSEVAARRWATPLGLVFIDGGHSYEDVHADYAGWAGHVMPAGYLLVHDIFEDPAKGGQAPYQIYNLALADGLFDEVARVETLGVLQRRRAKSVMRTERKAGRLGGGEARRRRG